MKIRTEFPHTVTILENVWIPLADGTRLAAKIWLPDNAHEQPVPALLEYIPYRKSDYTSARDAKRQAYFAGYGYANVRVDMRGSGDSDGILCDEYLPQEQDDALEVLAWIAAQPWCNGNIGMHGISWGGFNSLQVAVHRQTVSREATNGTTSYTLHQDSGRIRFKNHGLELDDISTHSLTIRDDDPLSLEQRVVYRLEYNREDWQVVMKTESKLTADATDFYITNILEAYEGAVRVFHKTWTKKIARNLI